MFACVFGELYTHDSKYALRNIYRTVCCLNGMNIFNDDFRVIVEEIGVLIGRESGGISQAAKSRKLLELQEVSIVDVLMLTMADDNCTFRRETLRERQRRRKTYG